MCGSLQGSILLPRQSTLLAPPTLQLESHSKGRLLSTQLMTSRPARGALSYGVVCHTCGCWLGTKPDCFSGLFTVLTEEETGELFGQFWATILCSIMLETCRQRGFSRKNPEGRLKPCENKFSTRTTCSHVRACYTGNVGDETCVWRTRFCPAGQAKCAGNTNETHGDERGWVILSHTLVANVPYLCIRPRLTAPG